jgi:two-component system cell cycle response regulator
MQEDWEEKTVVAGEVVAPASGRKRAHLIVLAGPNVGEMYEIDSNLTIGRGREADVRVQGDGISRKHGGIRVAGEEVVFEDLGSTNGSFINGERVVHRVLEEGDKIQIGTSVILKFTYHDELDEDFQRQMFESASRDALTQVYNKRFFMEQLVSEHAYAARHGSDLSLLMFDLDHFKAINDTHGHLAGDYVLAELTRMLMPAIRTEDVFARYGGEEFVVLSRTTGALAAAHVGERLRKSVEQHQFCFEGKIIQVTVSIGISHMPAPAVRAAEDLIALADKALYEAKNGGRNRVVSAAA